MERPGEETLIRYFLGKCDSDEQKVVSAYLALKIDEEYIDICLLEALHIQKDDYDQTEAKQGRERVWNALVSRQQSAPLIKLKPRMRWYGYAAAVAFIILSAGILFVLNNKINSPQEQVVWQHIQGKTGNAQIITLDDSTTVTLFPGSLIDIPSDFNRTDRKIKLKGRAFFNVAHNKAKPFYVTANELTTKVLGTSFEVNTVGTDEIITLHSGRVSVFQGEKEIARLTPNKQIKYQQKTGKFKLAIVDASSTLNWTHGELEYNRVPLHAIIIDIEKWYDVKIQIDDLSILDQKVIFSFKDQSLNRVLSLLSKSAGFNYEIKGKHVILKERSMDTN